MDKVLDRIKKMKNLDFDVKEIEKDKWAWYKHFMRKAIDFCFLRGKRVIVVVQPYLSPAHIEQQESFRVMLNNVYKGNKNLFYVNLGEFFSLKDRNLSDDGVHLTPKGCDLFAGELAQHIISYISE